MKRINIDSLEKIINEQDGNGKQYHPFGNDWENYCGACMLYGTEKCPIPGVTEITSVQEIKCNKFFD